MEMKLIISGDLLVVLLLIQAVNSTKININSNPLDSQEIIKNNWITSTIIKLHNITPLKSYNRESFSDLNLKTNPTAITRKLSDSRHNLLPHTTAIQPTSAWRWYPARTTEKTSQLSPARPAKQQWTGRKKSLPMFPPTTLFSRNRSFMLPHC